MTPRSWMIFLTWDSSIIIQAQQECTTIYLGFPTHQLYVCRCYSFTLLPKFPIRWHASQLTSMSFSISIETEFKCISWILILSTVFLSALRMKIKFCILCHVISLVGKVKKQKKCHLQKDHTLKSTTVLCWKIFWTSQLQKDYSHPCHSHRVFYFFLATIERQYLKRAPIWSHCLMKILMKLASMEIEKSCSLQGKDLKCTRKNIIYTLFL